MLAADVETTIPAPISDGTISPPAASPVLPDFEIKSTVVRELEVVEPPPMVGLPAVTGTITETVHLVEDPHLPDPVPAPQTVAVDGIRTANPPSGRPVKPRMLSLSATVYDHSRTLLCFRTGRNPTSNVTVWSNLDFNDFSGVPTFEVKDADGSLRRYMLMIHVWNEDRLARSKLLAEHGRDYLPPEIPTLPDGDPAYQIASGSPDQECLQMIVDLHQLYRNEGLRMKEAYLARIKAEEERRAYLLANPPLPKDVTIHFWERDHPVGMSADTIKKEGGN